MNNLDKPDRADQIADEIKFDRGPQHHDHTKQYFYCVECHRCDECSEIEIAAALRAYRNEALESAAKIAEDCFNSHRADQPCHGFSIRDDIRKLKTPEEGSTTGGKRA